MTAIPKPKKRVLFVDDEAMLLDLYRLVFEEAEDSWEINLSPSAKDALTVMESAPVDVLVSDMRMPGMSGAELVQEVMKRHPKTSRLIMSGYADAEQIAQCLCATHQFIAKPFEVSVLRGTISRVCSLDSWLLDERLKALVAQLRSLPSVPSLYFRIMDALGSPDSSLDQVGEIIASDPSMTAKILQLVNSAFFGIARRISNPTEAVQFLGIGRVRSLVLSLHVFSCFEEAKLGNFSIDAVWKHSMSTGLVAQRIARAQKADRETVDESYVAGMLHDIGKVMLATSLPEQYAKAVELATAEKTTLAAAEREVFGVSHTQIGAYLLGLWGLPISIVEAVAFHHDPMQAGVKDFSPLAAVHAANALEREIHPPEGGASKSVIDMEYLEEVGLEHRLDAWRDLAETALAETQ